MPPRGQQFALGFARARIETLRFPVKVGAIRSCLDEIQAAWEEEDLRQFPLNLVHGELAGLSAWLAHEHDDLDQEVDSKSAAYDWVLNLQHRLRMSTEFVVASRVYEDVERQYRRIDTVLPVSNYAIRQYASDLPSEHIGLAIKRQLEAALLHFERQEHAASLRECGQAEEALLALYRYYLETCGCTGAPAKVGLALGHIRQWLSNPDNHDAESKPFSPHARLEWLLLSLLETLHYFRNATHHPSDTDDRLPEWQREHRDSIDERLEYARLVLCLTLQLAAEVGILLGHQRKGV
jgi:hypothetical protein